MVIESKPNINPVSHQQQEPPKSSTLENGLLLPNVPRNEAPTDTFNSVPERPVVNESKKKIASESCWATEDKGWQKDKSYKTLSGLEKFRYALKNLNQKISVFFNAFRQMLSWKGERSKKILTDLNEQKRIDKQVVRSGGLSGPSATVKKLVDKEGVRAARLSSSDLTHLVLSIKAASKDRISVVDGYSMEQGGLHFLNVNKRKPSVKLKEEFDKKENKTILMPFVFPKKGLSEEHIVLIAVDPERKEIRYF
ncbi:hypothetical protein FJ364_06090, partial [Candidatus Dependentiae bacterium]|nr:hypothetical protein [Candidatus Dependentiae bacterium]